ncbi:MAG: hypothetical protein ACI9GC_001274, partial [Phycisphaerales bacterium]
SFESLLPADIVRLCHLSLLFFQEQKLCTT